MFHCIKRHSIVLVQSLSDWGNFIIFLVFNICVVTRANGVVGLFANIIANGKYGIMVFGWPWKNSK
jgi:hypothetical protein